MCNCIRTVDFVNKDEDKVDIIVYFGTNSYETIGKYKRILIFAALGKKTRLKKLRKELQSKLYKHGIDPYIAEYNYEIVATQEERLRQIILEKEDTLCNTLHSTVYIFLVYYEYCQEIRIDDSS